MNNIIASAASLYIYTALIVNVLKNGYFFAYTAGFEPTMRISPDRLTDCCHRTTRPHVHFVRTFQNPTTRVFLLEATICGARGNRTHDLLNANQML